MKITVLRVLHADQRYDTCGDWSFDAAGLLVTVSIMYHFESEIAVALHEAVEALLCRARGITGEQVDAFDFAHLDSDDPGDIPEAPYHIEHKLATMVEKFFIERVLGWNWSDHDETVANCPNPAIKGKSGVILEWEIPDEIGYAGLWGSLTQLGKAGAGLQSSRSKAEGETPSAFTPQALAEGGRKAQVR